MANFFSSLFSKKNANGNKSTISDSAKPNREKKAEEIPGHITYYNLQDWWLSAFSENERKYIAENPFMKGEVGEDDVVVFLRVLSILFESPKDSSIYNRIRQKVEMLEMVGYVNGRHYSAYWEDVKNLKRAGRLNDAEKLLLELVEAVELEARVRKWGVAPAYYSGLAKIYRKQKDYAKEVDILARYLGQGQTHREEFKKRLEEAKSLLITHRKIENE